MKLPNTLLYKVGAVAIKYFGVDLFPCPNIDFNCLVKSCPNVDLIPELFDRVCLMTYLFDFYA